jgi:hypothetical protein
VQSGGPVARSASVASGARVTTAVHREAILAASPRFELVPAGVPVADTLGTSSRPNGFSSAIGQLDAGTRLGGVGLLVWLLALLLGALLIALTCADAVGIGERHEFLRRRRGRSWKLPPWR